MDLNDFTPTELMLYGMMEDLKYEMLSRFEIQIGNLSVRLEQSIQYNELIQEKLEQNIKYSEYLMERLEEVYVKVDSHDVFINTVKNVEFELLEEVKGRKNGR
jgi:hypothetical protein